MAEITIRSIENERTLSEYLRRRGELRDSLRFGVYPNLVQALQLHAAFVADYAPNGTSHDPALWTYYLDNIKPVSMQMADMIAAAEAIVRIMEAVELAAPGTFGIAVEGEPTNE